MWILGILILIIAAAGYSAIWLSGTISQQEEKDRKEWEDGGKRLL